MTKTGENNPMWGKKRPQYVKDAVLKANKGKKHTKETIEKRKQTKIANGNNIVKPETITKILETRKKTFNNIRNYTDLEFLEYIKQFKLFDSIGRKNCRVCSLIKARGWDVSGTFDILQKL